jgi:glycosyltransferase involved in cell wall biosynthesis
VTRPRLAVAKPGGSEERRVVHLRQETINYWDDAASGVRNGRPGGSHVAAANQAMTAREPARTPPRLHIAEQAPPRVSIVIPTLNEARNLPHVFAKLPAWIHEIVLVDGNSTDGTTEVARELFPDVRIVGQSGRGKGNALRCGFEACTGDIIVMLDADGSADPAEIDAFVDALCGGADFAKGSRFVEGGGSSDITVIRRLGNWFFSSLVNLLYRTRYSDLCYGYNAFWRRCLPAINVDCEGFEVETLINIRVARAGLRIVEVPSFEQDRIHGESNLRTFRDGFRVLRTIFRELPRGRAVEQPTDVAVPAPEAAG